MQIDHPTEGIPSTATVQSTAVANILAGGYSDDESDDPLAGLRAVEQAEVSESESSQRDMPMAPKSESEASQGGTEDEEDTDVPLEIQGAVNTVPADDPLKAKKDSLLRRLAG